MGPLNCSKIAKYDAKVIFAVGLCVCGHVHRDCYILFCYCRYLNGGTSRNMGHPSLNSLLSTTSHPYWVERNQTPQIMMTCLSAPSSNLYLVVPLFYCFLYFIFLFVKYLLQL